MHALIPQSPTAPTKGKRGEISGASLTSPDVLASSKQILMPTRGSATKGLQQFFTPAEVGNLAEAVIGLRGHPTLDPTAGNGSLLAAASAGHRFGVEIDADQVAHGNYAAVRGDIQRVYPLLRASGLRFTRILCNPPFGLDDWNDPVLSGGKKINSALLAFRYSQALLHDTGAGVLIAGRDRFHKLITHGAASDADSVVLVLEIDDLFDGVALPTIVAFFAPAGNRRGEPLTLQTTKDELPDPAFGRRMRDAFGDRINHRFTRTAPNAVGSYTYPPVPTTDDFKDAWDAIQTEYDRRISGLALSQEFDVMIRKGKLSILPSPFAQLAMAKHDTVELKTLRSLHRQATSYFALNLRDWNNIKARARDGILTIDPAAEAAIKQKIEHGRLALRPMYPIPEQMRLGFLDDVDQIRCRVSDDERDFVAGQWYPIHVDSKIVTTTEQRLHENKQGDQELRRFKQDRKLLNIKIANQQFDESPESIKYITENFELPEVGDLASNHPNEIAAAVKVIKELETEFMLPAGTKLDDFQVQDLARCVVKERALMAWAPGGGKTMGQYYFAEACIRLGKAKRDIALFIAPQDLHDQWRRELTKFLGTSRTLESIQTPADAQRVRRHIKNGGTGWYITHYEALSLIGTGPTTALEHRITVPAGRARLERKAARRNPARDLNLAADTIVPSASSTTTQEHCPSCNADHQSGWTGSTCSTCGYAHYEVRVKNVASRLASTFKDGVICVDELSMVRGDTSKRSLALRGMRANCRLGASGTPISNYVNDCFWGLAWCIGWGSPRFPYDYHEGKAKFEADFCVVENMMGKEEDGESNQKKRRKILPEVTNLSMLWKLLSINMVRRRQRDMGEMVERTFHTVHVPMGIAQREMNQKWLSSFADFFTQKNPGHPLVEAGLVARFEAALGLLWKMEYAATLPSQDRDRQWHGIEVSNFTPKLVKALEVIEQRVAAGEKVLVGSCLIETGPLICRLLEERGIKARHITEATTNGKAKTKSPKKRAREVTDFVHGDTDVLCAGVQALKLGHNLDIASSVVLLGFPWSYEAFEQFLDRVWRRTSPKPVSVFCLIAKGSIDERKFKLLNDKTAASDVALDGRLIEENERPQDWNKILREMQAAGVPITGDEVDEAGLEKQWRSRPAFVHPRAAQRAAAEQAALHKTPLTPADSSAHQKRKRPSSNTPKYFTDVAIGEQTSFFG